MVLMKHSVWRYYPEFYKGSYRALLLTVLASIGQAFLVLPITLLIRYAFDVVVPSGDARFLLIVGAGLLGLNLANDGVALITRYFTLRLNKMAVMRLREQLLDRLYTFSQSFYGEADHKALHSSIVQDSERVDMMSNALVALVLPSVIASIIIGAVLASINSLLFLAVTSTVPLLLLVNLSMRSKLVRRINAYHQSFATFDKGIAFILQTIGLTRIQAAEQLEIERQQTHIRDAQTIGLSMAWSAAVYVSAQNMIVSSSSIIILLVGGTLTFAGKMTLGALLSFYVMAALLRNQINTALSAIPPIIAGNQSLRVLHNILDIQNRQPYGGSKRIDFGGEIALRAVDFQYKDEPVLRGVDLTIQPQTITVITGTNGAGKTTIVNLILGLYRPQRGQLYADEQPFDALDFVHLRRQIGVVPQDPLIFGGTVSENIAYGVARLPPKAITQAAELATAHEFIAHLPQGYETLVGEDGMLLSGGQRQRIAIARALLSRPKGL